MNILMVIYLIMNYEPDSKLPDIAPRRANYNNNCSRQTHIGHSFHEGQDKRKECNTAHHLQFVVYS